MLGTPGGSLERIYDLFGFSINFLLVDPAKNKLSDFYKRDLDISSGEELSHFVIRLKIFQPGTEGCSVEQFVYNDSDVQSS